MKIIVFIILISAKHLAGICIEEPDENEQVNKRVEKSLSAVDASQDIPNDFDDLEISKSSVDDNNYAEEVVSVKNSDQVEESSNEDKSAISLENENKMPGTALETQSEDIPDISKLTTEAEENLTEASVETTFSDTKNASPDIVEHDSIFDSESDVMEEKTDDLNLDENLSTRRMFSNYDIILNTKARSDYDASDKSAEVKIAPSPTTNSYNDNNEFDMRDHSRSVTQENKQNQNRIFLPARSFTKLPLPMDWPNTIQDQPNQNDSNFNTKSEENVNFSLSPSQFQRRHLPSSYEFNQRSIQSGEYMNGIQNKQIPIEERQRIWTPNNQQFYTSQRVEDMQRRFKDKTNINVLESMNQAQPFNQVQGTLISKRIYDTQLAQNFNRVPSNVQQNNQINRIMDRNDIFVNKKFDLNDKMNHRRDFYGNQGENSRSEMDYTNFELNPEVSRLHKFQPMEGKINVEDNLKNKQLHSLNYDQIRKPNRFLQLYTVPGNINNANNYNANLKSLYQRLVEASLNPGKIRIMKSNG